MSYQSDRTWTDQFTPAVMQKVGPWLLDVASLEVDQKQATDLVLKNDQMSIAVRIRRHGYAERFPGEITVRASRDSGAKTELAKILAGHANRVFYGHQLSPDSIELGDWTFGDLDVFRACHLDGEPKPELNIRWGKKSNWDGTHFNWYDVSTLPPEFLIAAGGAA